MADINWGKLYEQGRCREVGIPWTESELKEIYIKKTASVVEIRARYIPEQIKELEEKLEESKTIVKDEDETYDIVELKDKYKELFGKYPNSRMTIEKIISKIKDKLEKTA